MMNRNIKRVKCWVRARRTDDDKLKSYLAGRDANTSYSFISLIVIQPDTRSSALFLSLDSAVPRVSLNGNIRGAIGPQYVSSVLGRNFIENLEKTIQAFI